VRPRYEPLQLAHIARRRDHGERAGARVDELDPVARLDAERLAHRLGDGDLALAGEYSAWHGDVAGFSIFLTLW